MQNVRRNFMTPYKIIISTIILLSLFGDIFGQTDQKEKKYLSYDGLVSDLTLCFNCDLDTIVKSIRQRIKNYPIETITEFRKEKGDTLIEIVSFNKNLQPDYSYYYNNLLKIHFTQTDISEYILTVMNDSEMELKQYNVSANEIHITDYDERSNMSHYYAKIFQDSNTKIEFEKEWKNAKFTVGQSKTYKKENSNWILQKTNKVGVNDWPKSTSEAIKNDEIEGFSDLQKINLAHHSAEFIIYGKENDYLEKNNDSTLSFLPLKLKEGLESGTYQIHKKISKKWEMQGLLIDANILNGKLHGVYNEYDLKTGKIKIYCVFKFGKLDGRRTIYSYQKNGEYNGKITELWDNGKYVGRIH